MSLRRSLNFVLIAISLITITIVLISSFRNLPQQNSLSLLPASRFFMNSECITSCWEGLRPGITTLAEVEDFYKTEFNDNFETTNDPNEFNIYSAESDDRVTIDTVADQNHLFKVYIAGTTDLTLGKIVQTLNDPQYVHLGYNLVPDGSLSANLRLYYPEHGFIFGFNNGTGIQVERNNESGTDVCLNAEANISFAYVVIPGSIESVIESTSVPYTKLTDEVVDSIINQLVLWPGFTCVSFPFPP